MVDGARSQPDGSIDVMPVDAVPVSELTAVDRGAVRPAPVDYHFSPISVTSPPLRA